MLFRCLFFHSNIVRKSFKSICHFSDALHFRIRSPSEIWLWVGLTLTIPCLTEMYKILKGICFFLLDILKGLGPSVSSIYAPRLHFQEGPHWSWSWLSLFPRKEQLTGKSHKSRLGKFDAHRLQVITMFPLQRIPQKMMRTFSVFEGIFPVSSNLSPNLGIHQCKHGTLSADLWSRNWNL